MKPLSPPQMRPLSWKRSDVNTWRSLPLKRLAESVAKRKSGLSSVRIPIPTTVGTLGVEIAPTVNDAFVLHGRENTQLHLMILNVPFAISPQPSGSSITATLPTTCGDTSAIDAIRVSEASTTTLPSYNEQLNGFVEEAAQTVLPVLPIFPL
jgi:hypothetical protein